MILPEKGKKKKGGESAFPVIGRKPTRLQKNKARPDSVAGWNREEKKKKRKKPTE